MTTISDHRIEALQGPPDPELAERLVSFWTATGALDEQAARARLGDVLCVAFGPDDEIVGVNSAYADTAPLIGRTFWMYRRRLLPSVPTELDESMLEAAYDELARRYALSREGPVGVCVIVTDRAVIERDRDAIWPNGFLYAGYRDDGAQVRISYFDLAPIA
jgi:hypothetical protein